MASTDVLVAWVRSSCFMLIKPSWREVLFLICFAENWTVFIPKTSGTHYLGRIIRSLDASSVDFVQLWLQTPYFCNLSVPSLVHSAMHSPFTEMHLI